MPLRSGFLVFQANVSLSARSEMPLRSVFLVFVNHLEVNISTGIGDWLRGNCPFRVAYYPCFEVIQVYVI